MLPTCYGTLPSQQKTFPSQNSRQPGRIVILVSALVLVLLSTITIIFQYINAADSSIALDDPIAQFSKLSDANSSLTIQKPYHRNQPKTNETYFYYHHRKISQAWKKWLDTHKDYETEHLHLWLNNNNGPEPIRNWNPLGDDMIRS